MTDTSGTPPQTPAGWYPTPQGERWWDGNAWSDHFRAPPVTEQMPQQPVYQQPGYPQGQPGYPAAPYGASPYGAPQQPSHLARNLLIGFAILFVLLVGGCVAVVGLAGKAVNDAVDDATAGNSAPGGPDNPLTITPGEAFEVSGFSYAAGWGISQDPLGDVDITGLKVTNNRDSSDTALVEIKLLRGTEVLALSNCTTEQITVGTTTAVSCYSFDTLPTDYDAVTINDLF